MMSKVNKRPLLNRRLEGLGTTIFAEMSARAVATGSINLGQGFPDRDGPPEIAQAAADAILQGRGNQYPPGTGIPELRHAITNHERHFYGLGYDPDTEVLVTAGATEAVAAAMLALVEPGDEVIAFEPYYDSYAANIAMAGGVRVPVTLRPPDFRPDLPELAKAITPRTRLILLNSPHNPTGSVFTRDELAAIAALAIENDLLVVTDEVYEHLVFDGEHVPIAQFPGMRERTVRISSAGKTFSFTGWKIGWVMASPELVTRGQDGQAVPHLRQRRAVPVRDRAGPGPAGHVLRHAAPGPASPARPAHPRPGRPRLRGLPAAGHVLRHHRHQAPGRARRPGLLPRPARPRRRGRHPVRRLLRPPGGGPHPGPVRLLQTPGGPDRGAPPAFHG